MMNLIFFQEKYFLHACPFTKEMGPGLLESVYELCLLKEFENNGITAEVRFLTLLCIKDLNYLNIFALIFLWNEKLYLR